MIILEHNVETGEVIKREATAEELAQKAIDKSEALARQAEIDAQAAAKSALLKRLGITEAEAKLLLA